MRVVWLVGGQDSYLPLWKALLSRERSAREYLMRRAEKLEEIPLEHLQHNGTVILIDAFHPACAGFSSFEFFNKHKTTAHVYLLGEPATEHITEPYKHSFFRGFFPPLQRLDHSFMCGTLYHTVFFDHDVSLKLFLQNSGKFSTEDINSTKDFEQFEKLLTTFLNKFGIDNDKTNKLLRGLTLPHGKVQGGKFEVSSPFKIHFGLDPLKLVIAISSFSKATSLDSIKKDFTNSVQALGQKASPPNSIFPEFFHSIQHSETLLFFHGSFKQSNDQNDPVYLVTRLSFPKKSGEANASGYYFSFSHSEPSDEMPEEIAKKIAASGIALENTKVAEAVIETTNTKSMASKKVNSKDLEDILREPAIVGDKPRGSGRSTAVDNVKSIFHGKNENSKEAHAKTNDEPVIQNPGEVQKLNITITQLNQVCAELSKDLLHLMKTRRQATTDKELIDNNEHLKRKVETLQIELKKLLESIANKDKSIAELEEKIKKLMSETAAA
ncbi:MAG: hypothetical protein KA116_04895 [Proteobacteria bacterium]|nr:hypothetical protein [Pseudomonadota bacterium]